MSLSAFLLSLPFLWPLVLVRWVEGVEALGRSGGLMEGFALIDEALVRLLGFVHAEDDNTCLESLVLPGELHELRESLGVPRSEI
ncbi:uncharacterized protein N7503_004722 [Penicillium pulvis]|uniref:uncharacterized protein n=1 Tax=Penicillium pulvis TaxID=1562058 RepID=UPI002548ECBE|nr:uncharacterized protein N7503_004722 [Penicillium pulvis]KAJ5802272.1 hypothetical protein N7503_004722 [Penicillium pulvis]